MASVPPEYSGTARHDRGYAGEQAMGFILGKDGYFFVEGPGGAGGHSVTAPGFDGIAYNPKAKMLIVYDNKAYARQGNVATATAIDPTANLLANLDAVRLRVSGMEKLPFKQEISDALDDLHKAISSKSGLPRNVKLVVSNAYGKSTGVTRRLAKSGVVFLNVGATSLPKGIPGISTAKRRISTNVYEFAGAALGGLAAFVGEWQIDREVRRQLANEKAEAISNILLRGEGVLVIIRMEEWEFADYNGNRSKVLLEVRLAEGPDAKTALENWLKADKLLVGTHEGWRPVHEFSWIPPLDEGGQGW